MCVANCLLRLRASQLLGQVQPADTDIRALLNSTGISCHVDFAADMRPYLEHGKQYGNAFAHLWDEFVLKGPESADHYCQLLTSNFKRDFTELQTYKYYMLVAHERSAAEGEFPNYVTGYAFSNVGRVDANFDVDFAYVIPNYGGWDFILNMYGKSNSLIVRYNWGGKRYSAIIDRLVAMYDYMLTHFDGKVTVNEIWDQISKM